MSNSKKIKKVLIDDFDELMTFKKMMTEESFFENYDVSMKLVEGIACARGMVYVEMTDRVMTAKEREAFIVGQF